MLAYMDGLTKRLDASVVAGRVRDLREGRGLDQESVAHAAGLSPAYISRLERGAVPNPKVFDLERVARALDVPVTMLLSEQSGERDIAFAADFETLEAQIADLPADLAAEVMASYRQTMQLAQWAKRSRAN